MKGYTNFTKVHAKEFAGSFVGDSVITSITPVNAVAATLTTDLEGANNDMVFTAKTKGTIGNSVSIAYIVPSSNAAAEVVAVTGQAIVVTLRKSGTTLSTAAQVKAAIDADDDSAALVSVANASENTGAGEVIGMAATKLIDGVDGTVGLKGQLACDSTHLYVCVANNTTADTNWKSTSLS